MSKWKISGNRVGEFEDLGIIGDNFVSKLAVEGKEYFSYCPVAEAASRKKFDGRMCSQFAYYRYELDFRNFKSMKVEILGEAQ